MPPPHAQGRGHRARRRRRLAGMRHCVIAYGCRVGGGSVPMCGAVGGWCSSLRPRAGSPAPLSHKSRSAAPPTHIVSHPEACQAASGGQGGGPHGSPRVPRGAGRDLSPCPSNDGRRSTTLSVRCIGAACAGIGPRPACGASSAAAPPCACVRPPAGPQPTRRRGALHLLHLAASWQSGRRAAGRASHKS